MSVNRCTARHMTLTDRDSGLRSRLKELAEERKRFGARRLHVLLRREGLVLNHKRTERIYREEQLALRKCRTRKRVSAPRRPAEITSGPGECWAMDFVHDNLADGRAIRILTIIDLWDRTCPRLSVGFSQTGQSVIATLNSLKEQEGLPRKIRTDNGPEFTCNALKVWAENNGITLEPTRPGKPTDNGHIESFNGRLRDECLNQHIFESLGDAREKINEWMEDYNTVRPHGALGWLAPAAFREKNLNNQDINLSLV